MRNKVRFALFGLLIGASFALAPGAFARGHVSFGVNIGLPGLSLGYSDCRHCYGGYYGGGYGASYYSPAPVYYAQGPGYYGSNYYGSGYYGPAYYGGGYDNYPAYRGSYYNARVRNYRDADRYDDRGDRDRDYGRRASYYNRDGYRH